MIGLPEKNAKKHAIYDYEEKVFDILEKDKIRHLIVDKATGLGITEFFLRYIAWRCLSNDSWKGKQVCIVCGPSEELAIKLIRRMKRLFPEQEFTTKETVIQLNDCHIQSYPSNHMDAMRSLTGVAMVFLDEAAFWKPGQQFEARYIAERYIGKDNPLIVMVSTPSVPDCMFDLLVQECQQDPNRERTDYKLMMLPYQVGLDRIYADEDIEQAKKSPAFLREYCLKPGFGIGNVFMSDLIDKAITADDDDLSSHTKAALSAVNISMGIDPGWGSSKFAIVVTSITDGMMHVVDCREYDRAEYSYMAEICIQLVNEYNPFRVYIDSANPAFIKTLKSEFREQPDYERILASCKKDKIQPGERMRFVPINFRIDGRNMLSHLQSIVTDGLIKIPGPNMDPKFTGLIAQMRIARVSEHSGQLDKSTSAATFDALDALLLSAYAWRFQ